MSENTDRRVRRTKKALLGAFSALVFDRRYDEIQVGDIVDGADIGRSTFYEHYRGKDDLLVQSMSGMLDVLAEAACVNGEVIGLEHILAHFWENRQHARYMLAGPPAEHVFPLLSRELANRIEERLRAVETALPRRLAAVRSAEGTFALIRAWLSGEAKCNPADIAAGLRANAID